MNSANDDGDDYMSMAFAESVNTRPETSAQRRIRKQREVNLHLKFAYLPSSEFPRILCNLALIVTRHKIELIHRLKSMIPKLIPPKN